MTNRSKRIRTPEKAEAKRAAKKAGKGRMAKVVPKQMSHASSNKDRKKAAEGERAIERDRADNSYSVKLDRDSE